MGNDSIPHPLARFDARQDNCVRYLNGGLGDLGLAGCVMTSEIWGRGMNYCPDLFPSFSDRGRS